MGNVADQLSVLFFYKAFFFCRFFQTAAHFLEILAKLGKFVFSFYVQNEIQIALFYILRRFF